MELDQSKLQLILNVLMITGLTSLALICRLLRRDNQRLTAELHRRPERSRIPLKVSTRKAAPNAGVPLHSVATPNTPSMLQHDIRQYVAQRMQSWSASAARRASQTVLN
ncbi:MAG TPA: hypothetical protein VN841_08445 [Bryobacteraceae bacterium]|nr:hypothetical protein [Bryobacteraceae bacterium]